jgi:hypothetical protein
MAMSDQIEEQEFTCPECGSHCFGTYSEGASSEGQCHGRLCRFTWNRLDDARYFRGTGHFHSRTVQGQSRSSAL